MYVQNLVNIHHYQYPSQDAQVSSFSFTLQLMYVNCSDNVYNVVLVLIIKHMPQIFQITHPFVEASYECMLYLKYGMFVGCGFNPHPQEIARTLFIYCYYFFLYLNYWFHFYIPPRLFCPKQITLYFLNLLYHYICL